MIEDLTPDVCDVCAAVVVDLDRHGEFHAAVRSTIETLLAVVAELNDRTFRQEDRTR